jgi:hypothetical protein
MNFISEPSGDTPMELKYCERCGGLWLRAQGVEGVYCPGCSVRLAELPGHRDQRNAKRSGMKKPLQAQGCIASLLGVEEAGVVA